MKQNTRTELIVGGIILAVLIVVLLIWGGVSGWHFGAGWGMMGGFGFGAMILFWVLIIWGVVALARGLSPSDSQQSSSLREESALEVLKKRYARGEIDKAEFEEKKRDLI